jgi:hypothetical protein
MYLDWAIEKKSEKGLDDCAVDAGRAGGGTKNQPTVSKGQSLTLRVVDPAPTPMLPLAWGPSSPKPRTRPATTGARWLMWRCRGGRVDDGSKMADGMGALDGAPRGHDGAVCRSRASVARGLTTPPRCRPRPVTASGNALRRILFRADERPGQQKYREHRTWCPPS